MAIISELKQVLNQSALTFEEVKAFEAGLITLSESDQKVFASIVNNDPEIIYPLYINFKAKLRAARGTEKEWEEAIETEINQLEDYLNKKRVGDEVK